MNTTTGTPFDLNIEEVLEHWDIPEALRELIANALDEQALTTTQAPEITEIAPGTWRIRDWGRGLRQEHFTQREDPEKLAKAKLVIGKFGFGLKDAVAALDRRGVQVKFQSRHADISIRRLPKHGFEHIQTLHAVVAPSSQPDMAGTEIELVGVSGDQIEAAKALFLAFAGDAELETTKYGSVLDKGTLPARIYINGLRVAEEPNFLFSYNLTSLTKGLRDALNRERNNVGRQAYSERIKDILKACRSEEVAGRLADDLALFAKGRMHDENAWLDVSLHACRILNERQKVVFVTSLEQLLYAGQIDRAMADGHRIVVVPDTVAQRLPRMKDLAGNPIRGLGQFVREWNDSFSFDFVKLDDLTSKERTVYELAQSTLRLVKPEAKRVKEVLISNTMRLSASLEGETLGVWEPATGRVIVKRDQLRSRERFLGTLLHEVGHAFTAAPDVDVEFENGLTHLLGKLGSSAVGASSANAPAGRRPGRASRSKRMYDKGGGGSAGTEAARAGSPRRLRTKT